MVQREEGSVIAVVVEEVYLQATAFGEDMIDRLTAVFVVEDDEVAVLFDFVDDVVDGRRR